MKSEHPQDVQAVLIEATPDFFATQDVRAAWSRFALRASASMANSSSMSLTEEIKAAVSATCATTLPAGALAKTANYTRPKLTRFLEYPELELSNGPSLEPHSLGSARFLALVFVYFGASKFGAHVIFWIELFARIGIGQWFRYFTGSLEVICAVLLLIPRTSGIARSVVSLNDGRRDPRASLHPP
jgi:DoxX-like family